MEKLLLNPGASFAKHLQRLLFCLALISGMSASLTLKAQRKASAGRPVATQSIVAVSNDATLSAMGIGNGFSLSPAFSSSTTEYTINVPNSTTGITVSATVNQPNATLTISGAPATSGRNYIYNLYIGRNDVNWVVTAQDGTTKKTYHIAITRAKSDQTITFDPEVSKTYGDANYAPGATASSGLFITYTSSNPSVASFDINFNVRILGAGTTILTAKQAGNSNYNPATATQTLTVSKASQTLSLAATSSKTYGDADYSPGATASSGLSATYSSSNPAVATIINNNVHIVGAGTTTITASQAGNNNYNAAADVTQTLTVTPQSINVTANSGQGKIYGNTDPALTYTAPAGVTFTGAPARAAGESVGNYAVTRGTLSAGDNYNINFTGSNFSIAQREVYVTPDNPTKIYGDPDPVFAYRITQGSLLAGDSFTGNLTREPGEDVASWPIDKGSLAINNTNYILRYVQGYLDITPAPLTVSAHNKTKDYLAAMPVLTYHVSGFKNGDTKESLASPVQINTLADASSAPGDYAIVVSNAESDNYNISFVNGTLTVNAPSADATLSNLTTSVGSLDPVFNPNTTEYEIAVPRWTQDVNITPTANNAYAGITVDGNPVTSGSSSTRALQPGDNPVAIVVTAQNGTTKQYNLNVKVPLENIAELFGIFVTTDAALNPSFDPNVHTYTMDVPNGTSFLRIMPLKVSNYATVTINGTTYDSFYPANLATGANVFEIVSTSQDRSTTETYTLTINRALSANNNLSALALDGVTLSPSFDAGTTFYTADVPNAKSSVTVTASLEDTGARVKIGDDDYTNSIEKTVNLSTGTNAIVLQTKAQNGDEKTYVVQVVRALSADATLSNLVANAGDLALSPGFSSGITSYTTQAVPFTTTSVDITPTVNDGHAYVKVNGTVVISGNSITVPLNIGSNSISLLVTAQNGSTKEYTLTINRTAASTNTNLANITFSDGAVSSPAFNPAVTNYEVIGNTTNVSVTPSVQDPKSVVTIEDFVIVPGSSAGIGIDGGNQVIFKVKAENGDTKSYTLNFKRVAGDVVISRIETTLPVAIKSQSNTPLLSEYKASVGSDVNSFTVKAVLPVSTNLLTINGEQASSDVFSVPIRLRAGLNTIDIVARAEDGNNQKVYRLLITKLIANNALLATIQTSDNVKLKQVSGSNNPVEYTAAVGATVSSYTVKPTTVNQYASLTIDGQAATSGVFSSPIALHGGLNTTDIVVTAEDGTTTKAYRIKITKTASNNALLSTIETNPEIGLKIQSNTATLAEYKAGVGAAVNSIAIKGVTNNSGATITVNGTTATSGAFSTPVGISVGVNTIDVVVTAEDHITTKTYRLVITKTVSSDAGLLSITANPDISIKTVSSSGSLAEYKATVGNSVTAISLKGLQSNAGAALTINGMPVANNTFSALVPLAVGVNTIDMVVTAEDMVTTKTYRIAVTRQMNALAVNRADSRMFAKTNTNMIAADDVVVHQALSPNGDGTNDFLVIEGLSNTSSNKLSVMNAAGALVYEAKDYGKEPSNVFTGRSRSGDMLKAGTYYYALDYRVGTETKRKTGFLILKY